MRFLRPTVLATLAILSGSFTAHAANLYQVIPTCGSANPPLGNSAGYMDQNGNVCTSGSGGGSSTVTVTGPLPTGTNALGTVSLTGSLPTGSNTLGTVTAKTPSGTPVVGLVTTVTTGGTAVTVFNANTIVNGAVIQNPTAATEPLFLNPLTTSTTAGGGANISLAPGQIYTLGPLTTAVSVNAATAAHVFSAYRY